MKNTEISQDTAPLERDPIPNKMPSPPEFLVKQQKILTATVEPIMAAVVPTAIEGSGIPVDWALGNLNISESVPAAATAPILHVPAPRGSVDILEYQQALEDRRRAEIQNAEIYAQYIEVMDLNERLLRARGTLNRFKLRVRRLYERALTGDKKLDAEIKMIRPSLAAAERAVNDLQIENESLRISLEANQEAQNQILNQLSAAAADIEALKKQLGGFNEECENRGILLDEADRKIRGYLSEMDQLSQSLAETQDKLTLVRNDNLVLQNQMRELQLREAGVATLNTELADAVTRSQRQIHELEDRLQLERKQSQGRIGFLEQEIQRLRENLRAENLVEQSRNFQQTYSTPPSSGSGSSFGGAQTESALADIQEVTEDFEIRAIPTAAATSTPSAAPKKQWNEFYNRWSHIINELSSHSKPIKMDAGPDSEANSSPSEQLLSEDGDISMGRDT